MKRPAFVLLFSLFFLTGFTQHSVTKHWDARFGGTGEDDLYAIAHTVDGGILMGGESISPISGNKTQANWGGYDLWIVKADVNGNYVWDKRYGGTGDEGFSALYITSDGGSIIGGFSESAASGDKTQNAWGGYDYWIVKLDSFGNKQWDKRFGGTGDDILDKVIQTRDGGYILAGFSYSGISGDKTQANRDSTQSTSDYWIVKTDSAGNKQWDKRFGGTLQDLCRDIIQTPDGGYLIGGSSASDSSGDKTQPNFTPLDDNFWIVKVDSLGNKQWDKVYGGVLGEDFKNALNTADGNYLLGGTSYDNISGNKTSSSCGYWLVKIDTAGNKLGDWAYGNCGTMNMVSATFDGGYLLTGVSGEMLTIKIDSQMNVVLEQIAQVASGFSAGALETITSCYQIGVSTTAGIGGDKSQPNWDTTDATPDYWIVEYCDSLSTGIQEPEGNMHLLMYPNPTTNDLNINIQKDDLKEALFTLTNTTGQIIYQSTDNQLSHSYTKILDLTGLPSGVYMLEVIVDGERIVKKILKE